VSRLYRQVAAEEPLAQGDIFHDIPAPDFSFNPLYRLVAGEGGVFREERVDGDVQQDMNIIATVDLVPAIVLDQSCDTLGVDRILLAPLVACDLDEKSPKEQWDYISKLGTSLHTPTRLYLADDPVLGFPRQYIDLGAKFVVSREDMEFFVKRGKRVATLSLKNLIYFQHRLAVVFSRVARDDIDWLSRADLVLKGEVLEAEVKKKRQGLESKEAALGKARTAKEREDLEDDIDARKRVLQDVEYELSIAKKSLVEVEQSGQVDVAESQVLPEEPRESNVSPGPAGASVPAEDPGPGNTSPSPPA
jgi:hypothetical protein